jgi:hypothetical protein
MSHCSFCEISETQATEKELNRVLAILAALHIEKNQDKHIFNPSGVCTTCRAVDMITKDNA